MGCLPPDAERRRHVGHSWRVWALAALAVIAAWDLTAGEARADPILAAAGDISCPAHQAVTASTCDQAATAQLISRFRPSAVAVLGDIQYPSGTFAEFTGSGAFGATWGRFKPLLHPAPGNHEYDASPHAHGYFEYFGGAAGPAPRGYYSYDIGNWHLVALNSNCSDAGCGNYEAGRVTTAEAAWLKSDLAVHSGQCLLAYWHHPRFSSGEHGNEPGVAPLWDALYAAKADVVLSGHDHDYERFAKQNPEGVRDAGGIREFVVGTGGRDHYTFKAIDPNSEFRDDTHYGVLLFTLHSESYDWQFRDVRGAVLDSGSDICNFDPPSTGDSWVLPAALAGGALLLGIALVMWRRRMTGR
ncbi:MAG: metallophosphoesterase family protein [Solirubrobacteraceae bacterium]